MRKAMELAAEKGASAWLTTLPIAQEGYDLHKQAFRDALCLRYGWDLARLPSTCICGSAITVGHSLSCSYGAFPMLLLGRWPCSRLDLSRPNVVKWLESKRSSRKPIMMLVPEVTCSTLVTQFSSWISILVRNGCMVPSVQLQDLCTLLSNWQMKPESDTIKISYVIISPSEATYIGVNLAIYQSGTEVLKTRDINWLKKAGKHYFARYARNTHFISCVSRNLPS